MAALLCAALLSLLGLASPAAAKDPGRGEAVKFIRDAQTTFTNWLLAAESNGAVRTWMKDHYWQMRGYHPFFTNHTFEGHPSWKPPPTQDHRNLYALYRDSADDQQAMSQHPEWVLKSAANGQPLYIPYGCEDAAPGCPAFAGDIGNPAFRDWWIARARKVVRHGYAGISMDDVNLISIHTGDGAGNAVVPRDPRTGAAMTHSNWKRYTAKFVEEIKDEFPNKDVTVNANAWWIPHDDEARRVAKAADFTNLERGFADTGITGGGGTFGYETMLAHVDWLHDRGSSVMYQPYLFDAASRDFELASYFLVKERSDAIISDFEADRTNWWSGWETYLGGALGKRYRWPDGGDDALFRRDFAGGMVLVNDPGSATRAVSLPSKDTWSDLDGDNVTSVTVAARRGAILVRRIKTKIRQKLKCKTRNGKRKLLLRGRVLDRSGARINPPFPRKLKLDVERKSGGWDKLGSPKARLKGKSKFKKYIDAGTGAGKYRVRTRFKGNARYFPARSRASKCSF